MTSRTLASYTFRTDGDNYSPVPRTEYWGYITEHRSPDDTRTVYRVLDADMPDAHRAVYLLAFPDGRCLPYYVAGWSDREDSPKSLLLYPLDGAPRGWSIGPRRAYYMTLTGQ